jgi:hypothetical protein
VERVGVLLLVLRPTPVSDMDSRTRPGRQLPPPGPRELRYVLELTLVYTHAMEDTITVFGETMLEHPELRLRYARLIDHLRSLVSPGEGGLLAVERECRALLGEGETT